jgi:6-phospho-beta-glucosidase
MKVAVLGGGGFRFPLVYRELSRSAVPIDELVLHDISAERLRVIEAVVRGDGIDVRTTTELDGALEDAGLVFAALRVGGVDARVRDEREAIELGVIGQETVGAGGLASALRVVPVVDDIAGRVARLAPAAWVVSMTNPAGIVTEAMAASLGDRVIGVCDSPVALIRRVCAALDLDPGASLAEVTATADVDYLGLNHLGWLRSLRVDGTDLLPAFIADPDRIARVEEGRLFGADFLQALGTVPNEYLYWFYARDDAYRALVAAGRTRGEHVRDEQDVFYRAALANPEDAAKLWHDANDERNRSYFAELRVGERDQADIAVGGYESVAVALAEALTGGAASRLVLNVRNATTIASLPPDAVIETVCEVDGSGARPLSSADPNAHELGLISTIKDCERTIIAAARQRSPELALRAFATHPLVGSLTVARELANRAMARASD